MPEHTIAENLSRLITAKTDIANAITTMGGVVGENDGFEEFPTDILGIPTQSSVSLEPYDFSSGFQTTSERDITLIYRAFLPDNSIIYVIDVARLNSSSSKKYYMFSFDNVDSSYNVIKYSGMELRYSVASQPDRWMTSSNIPRCIGLNPIRFTASGELDGGSSGYVWRIFGVFWLANQ